jgi:hypothetical protein
LPKDWGSFDLLSSVARDVTEAGRFYRLLETLWFYSGTSVHEHIFRTKKSRMTNGVSDYEHASWQQRQDGDSGKLRVSARECQLLVN